MRNRDDVLRFERWLIYPTTWGICRVLASYDRSDERVTLIDFDVATVDRERWLQLRYMLNWLDPGGRWARACYKSMRRMHDESRQKTWDQVLPRDIVSWAWRTLNDHATGCNCVDNTRVARIGNTAQMRRYRRALKYGCCGFADFEKTAPDGRRYRLGYNFGH